MYTLPNTLVVSAAESGQKLLQFLQRRLRLPPMLLHRWIRTGQTRVNGGRSKPFTRLTASDAVRLPPFAADMARQGGAVFPRDAADAIPPPPERHQPDNARCLSVVGVHGDIWALFKPSGLPTHPGSGHLDSLATRLAQRYAAAPFKPTPAHRLDKDTSGILLVAASFMALRELHEALRGRELGKEYVAWVRGRWPYPDTRTLRHCLGKTPDRERESLCVVRPLIAGETESLILIRLITGRTHQIRLQTASIGHPVVGDVKYGAASSGPMYLHALRVTLPDGKFFACLPDWPAKHALSDLPEQIPQQVSLAKGCDHA
jgi:23S rRNA pseudouridine955/2504/2580 synthase